MYHFSDARQALIWATEILRKQRYPQISDIYLGGSVAAPQATPAFTPAEEANLARWYGEELAVPEAWGDKVLLANQVYRHLEGVSASARQALLKLQWGDYADPHYLAQAQLIQEHLRRRGLRTRLCYRYSYRQVAERLGADPKTIRRWEDLGLQELEQLLQRDGLIYHDSNVFLSA